MGKDFIFPFHFHCEWCWELFVLVPSAKPVEVIGTTRVGELQGRKFLGRKFPLVIPPEMGRCNVDVKIMLLEFENPTWAGASQACETFGALFEIVANLIAGSSQVEQIFILGKIVYVIKTDYMISAAAIMQDHCPS
jgi:hypothetical protein